MRTITRSIGSGILWGIGFYLVERFDTWQNELGWICIVIGIFAMMDLAYWQGKKGSL